MSADINKTINHSESGQLFRQSGQTLQSLLEHSLDAIALVDTQGKVLYISPSVHRLLGYTADELIGRIAFELVHPDDRAKTISALVAVLQQPGTSLMVEYRLQHKDGTFRWMEATATNLLHDPNVGAIVGNFHDITERKWIETLLEGQNRVLEMVAQSAALQDVLEELVHLIEQHSSHDVFASILLLDKDGLHLRYGAAPGLPEDYNAAINDITIGPIAGSYGAAAYRREPVCVSDITTDPLWAEYKHLALAHGLQTCWSTPICSSSGKVLGTFAMYYREPRHPSPHEQQLINLVTRTVTIAIERKQAEEQAQFLAEVSKVLASTLDYQQTLANIARLVVPQLADWFVVDLVDAQGHFELVEVAHTDPDKVQWAKTLRNLFPLDPNASIGVANVVRTGQAELYPDIPDELLVAAARNEEELAIARQIGFSSGMHVSLVARGKILGVVTFVSAESGRRYDERDLALAEEVGRRAGVALDNAQLYRAMRQGRDQLDIILQGVADGIIVYDTHSEIIYANEAAAKLTGFVSVQAMRGTPPLSISARYEIIDEQGRPFPRSRLTHTRVLAGERDAEATIGYYNRATEQSERWSFVKSRPVFDEQGQVLYVITIIHDITERVLTERRKDEFISIASHELKTPVTSLKGFTQLLQRRLTKQGNAQEEHYLSRMDAQLNKLTNLIGDLLDISKIRAGKLDLREEAFDLDTLVQETVENVQATTSTHHLLIEGRAEASIMGDKDRLEQVFINLLTNAIKYSSQADKVIVHLSQDQSQEQAIVSVQDFGIGIDKAYHQQIFQRFYQITDPTERTFSGLGIGLYISHEIVERHHGRMWVESTKGEGATFYVALPLLQERVSPLLHP